MKNKIIKLKEYLVDEEVSEFKRFMIVVIILFVILYVVFLFTKFVVNDGDVNIVVLDSTEGAINYNMATVGTMLNKADDEYYVLIFDSESSKAPSYQTGASLYTSQDSDDVLAVYHVDLSNVLNSGYLADSENEENVDATTIEDMYFGDITLIKVLDGEVVLYLNDLDSINEELAIS